MNLPDKAVDLWRVVLQKLEQEKSQQSNKMLRELDEDSRNSGYTLSELQVIDLIEKLENPNVTLLAERMKMTRGAISKIVSRLKERHEIDSYQYADNQKKLYYRLTSKGEKICHYHRAIHEEAERKVVAFFEHYSDEDLQVIIKFLTDVSNHVDGLLVD
ncbi:MarR family transcriptional regulator [Pullulanibacillus sp. KACC 23026]|uniref:MarR family winged helix-turn-helix transcriptional regulator n=1 Tax=Pullulanibacillus sp. KACC 23026 TaxID=3028315 RepID=UPI0023AE7185|nr:MarR family transcriptional regulator [Pullulanibacillus sp. KACC 23026]WEG14646.1 MarR family transcriptional regulator [Pullulanibacillus sp. KACC 23026]